MHTDPIIDEIREIRHRISEECGHDSARLVEYYIKLQETEYADRLIKTAPEVPDRQES
ncbi:MAG TPA: hypothetical protein VMZ50_08965 [Phycisphaerae bacterium]|nr:hypothetical protein [Phycisphaerae bacterium]